MELDRRLAVSGPILAPNAASRVESRSGCPALGLNAPRGRVLELGDASPLA